ncbi:hypothetical protein Gogos_003858 [Gossypium gossypioides]|uniref:Uncharacterized protein n=1 Tax=Gossypium gossypioides TaxID=34282 RepID=A0A7J9CNB4_GOSGO|nr:hypothetical protein [Gossypium gossypioides]
MLSVFSSEPQNSTQILKLNVAVALHLVLCWTFTEFPSPPPAPPPEFEASGFTNFYETAENLSDAVRSTGFIAPIWFFFQGLQLLKASPTVMSLEICFELKMVVIYISLNEEANKDFRKPSSLYNFGHENNSFGKKYFNEGEILCVEFKGYCVL